MLGFDDTIQKECHCLLPEIHKQFCDNYQNFYINSCQHIIQKTSLSHGKVLKNIRCINPRNVKKNSSIRDIKCIADILPVTDRKDQLVDEWKLLANDDIPILEKYDRIEKFWMEIFEKKTCMDTEKYPNISKVVKAALTLSHGNSDVERSFSISGNILSEERTALSLRGLNARMNVLSGLKSFQNKPENFPLTKELFRLACNAHGSYMRFLEDEANAQKAEKEKQKQAQFEKEMEKEQLQHQQEDITILEKDLTGKKKQN